MLLSGAPAQLVLPWGNSDSSKTSPIPVPSQIGVTPGAASWTDGFPPLCATPVTSGGIPPAKADMNGGLFQMSAIDVWYSAGAGFPYSSGFSTAIGGYPKGARVLMATGLGYWRSTADNNTTDPDTGGAGWVPEAIETTILLSGTGSGNYVTASASPAEVGSGELQHVLTIPVGWVLTIQAAGTGIANSGGYVLLVDSVVGTLHQCSLGPTEIPWSLVSRIVGDGASHTINLAFYTNGTPDMTIINTTSPPIIPQVLLVLAPSN